MNLGISARLPSKCFFKDCPSHTISPDSVHIIRKGFYKRLSDAKRIPRFYCHSCKRSFSSASYSPCLGQKRRKLNHLIRTLLASGVTQRRIARILGTTRKTVARKLIFLAEQSRLRHDQWLASIAEKQKIREPLFDEMESFERSKCLPLSIPLVVDKASRRILGIRACSMPAKGLLAEISRKKYGFRADDRAKTAKELFASLRSVVAADALWLTDQNPKYPSWLKSQFPHSTHVTTKGRRGCVVGQGELKEGGYDPLFALNHTCAMIRANISRLVRRTWATTKKRERLEDHLAIYMDYHNHCLVCKISCLRPTRFPELGPT